VLYQLSYFRIKIGISPNACAKVIIKVES